MSNLPKFQHSSPKLKIVRRYAVQIQPTAAYLIQLPFTKVHVMANTTRMELRIGKSVKAAAEKAAALKGRKSLTEYVVDLIEKDAEAVIREHQLITLNDAVFDHFMATCNGENAPNKKLREAKEFTK